MVEESRNTPAGLAVPDAGTSVALYDTHQQALDAIRELERSGCDMQKLSIISRDYYTEEGVVGYYSTGDQMKAWGKTGAHLGALWSDLSGSAFFLIPGIGPLFIAGPVVGRIVEGLEAAAGIAGLSPLGTALYRLGVPRADIGAYETDIRGGKFVLVVQ